MQANVVNTFVYWNVSCLPVKVASIDIGAASIWHIPGAEHSAKHWCDSLCRIFNLGTWLRCDTYSPTQMMHVQASSNPVEVWLDAKPSTMVTCNRTQPRIAGMSVMILVAVKNQLGQFGQVIISIDHTVPRNTTPLRAGICFTTRSFHPFEGAWLVISCVSWNPEQRP